MSLDVDRHAGLVLAGGVHVGQRADVGAGPVRGGGARGQGGVGVGPVRRRVPRRDLGVGDVERAVLRRERDDVGREVRRPAAQPQLVDVAARGRAAQGERGALLDLQVDVQLPDLVRRVHLHQRNAGAEREDAAWASACRRRRRAGSTTPRSARRPRRRRPRRAMPPRPAPPAVPIAASRAVVHSMSGVRRITRSLRGSGTVPIARRSRRAQTLQQFGYALPGPYGDRLSSCP